MRGDPSEEDLVVSVESGLPGDASLTVRVTQGYEAELRTALDDAGLRTSDIVELSVAEVLSTAFAVFISTGGVEQFATVLEQFATVLKSVFSRNQHKHVEFYANGHIHSTEGMSAREIAKLLSLPKVERDQQWQQALPQQQRELPKQGGDHP
jgi:hypothetical protein